MLWLLTLAAQAGNLYVNGTLVDARQMPNVTLDKVTVRFDAQGNIFVDAPGYKIQVAGTPQPMPSMGAGGGFGAPMPQPMAPPMSSGVMPARWWMVTEDNASTGHQI